MINYEFLCYRNLYYDEKYNTINPRPLIESTNLIMQN